MKNYCNEIQNCVYVVHLQSQHGIGRDYFDRLNIRNRRGSLVSMHAACYLSIGNDRAILSQLAIALQSYTSSDARCHGNNLSRARAAIATCVFVKRFRFCQSTRAYHKVR